MMMRILVCLAAVAVVGLAGCQPATRNVDTVNDEGKAVMGLDYRDFDQAAAAMVGSLIRSGSLKKADGSRYVMATGRVVNDTTLRINTDQLMAKIEQEMMNSGQVAMTSAVGDKAGDAMIYEMRDMRDSEVSDEFQDDTLPAKRQLIAPELTVSGRIFQSNVAYGSKEQQVEYYFMLYVQDLATGLRFWQNQTEIVKRGSNKSVSW